MPRQLLHSARRRSSAAVGCSASANAGGAIARSPSRPRPAVSRSSPPRCSVDAQLRRTSARPPSCCATWTWSSAARRQGRGSAGAARSNVGRVVIVHRRQPSKAQPRRSSYFRYHARACDHARHARSLLRSSRAPHMPTLLIADDHPLFRAALRQAAADAVAGAAGPRGRIPRRACWPRSTPTPASTWCCSTCTCPATTAWPDWPRSARSIRAWRWSWCRPTTTRAWCGARWTMAPPDTCRRAPGLDELRDAIRSRACLRTMAARLAARDGRTHPIVRARRRTGRAPGQPVAAAVPGARCWWRRAC